MHDGEMFEECPLERIEKLEEECDRLKFVVAELSLKLLDRDRQIRQLTQVGKAWRRVALNWKRMAEGVNKGGDRSG